jgi:D-Tyr-tRNAtyr deacylase
LRRFSAAASLCSAQCGPLWGPLLDLRVDVATGVFGARMSVEANDGPVTIVF